MPWKSWRVRTIWSGYQKGLTIKRQETFQEAPSACIWPFASALSFSLAGHGNGSEPCLQRERSAGGHPTCPSLSRTVYLKEGEMLTELQVKTPALSSHLFPSKAHPALSCVPAGRKQLLFLQGVLAPACSFPLNPFLLTPRQWNSLDLWTVEHWGGSWDKVAGADELPFSFPWQADPKERYPISELLADLESCNAHRVLLFLDQSYTGPLAKKLRVSKHHPNVVLLRSGTTNGGSSFAEFWAGLQPDQCLLQHFLPVSARKTLSQGRQRRTIQGPRLL